MYSDDCTMLDVNKDQFRLYEDGEEFLGPEVPCLSATGALMYLTYNTRPDIAFAINLLTRFSSSPTRRHWNRIKHVIKYLKGTIDMGLFYSNNSKSLLVGYVDVGYLLDPHKDLSQIGYLFTCGGYYHIMAPTKQALLVTFSIMQK